MADNSVSRTESDSAVGASVVQSIDAAEHAGRIRGWNMRMDQVSSGRFAGRLVTVRLSGLEIIRETTTQALIKQGAAWRDALVFCLPLAASNPGHFNGRALAFPNVLLSDGADLPPLVTSTARVAELECIGGCCARCRCDQRRGNGSSLEVHVAPPSPHHCEGNCDLVAVP